MSWILDGLSSLGGALAVILVLRAFPDILSGAILKDVDRRNNERIEKLKDELSRNAARELEGVRADYANLRASTDYLAANQSELRSRMIAATDLLWQDMLKIRDDFGVLINFESILLPNEIAEIIELGAHSNLAAWIEEYRDEQHVNAKLMASSQRGTEGARVFVGDRVWLTYYVCRAIILRIAYMTHGSLKEHKYRDWRTDAPTLGLLRAVLDQSILDKALKDSIPSLTHIVSYLENQFLTEAMRLMSGSKVFADSIADVRATMAIEAARLKDEADRSERA